MRLTDSQKQASEIIYFYSSMPKTNKKVISERFILSVRLQYFTFTQVCAEKWNGNQIPEEEKKMAGKTSAAHKESCGGKTNARANPKINRLNGIIRWACRHSHKHTHTHKYRNIRVAAISGALEKWQTSGEFALRVYSVFPSLNFELTFYGTNRV